MTHKVIHGDSAQELKKLADNSIDAVVTDPPYGIEFLAKEWDSNTGAVEIWSECLRVLKPGGYLLAFSAARTYHHLATNIESVGFEIRDQIMWLYASGFPKAQDIGKSIQRRQGVEQTKEKEMIMQGGFDNWVDTQEDKNAKRNNQTINEVIPTSPEAKQWAGWKTALKPAHEPICMARKPFKGSTIDNVLTHGVGALNIDASRIESEPFDYCADGLKRTTYSQSEPAKWNDSDKQMIRNDKGRFPSNVLGEVEGYQKFFYCPKVSRRERHRGFEQVNEIDNNTMLKQMGGYFIDSEGNKALDQLKQHHMVYVPTLGKFYVHGLKHEYEQWCKKNKQDPLSHLGRQNYNDGWHCEDANRKKDPLAHIPSNPSGMYEQDERGKCGTRYEARVENTRSVGNNHPTVKPVALMRYLVQLVTPQGAHVLDPFCGSGSTGMACKELGNTFTGIEQDKNYVTIAQQRIDATVTDPKHTLFE